MDKQLKTFKLKNGVQVAAYKLPNLQSIYMHVTAKGGSSLDPKGKSGAAHFMEHMLLKGIPSYPNEILLAEAFESVAGYYNAYTSFSSIDIEIQLPHKELEKAIKIGSEIFFEPLFPIGSFEKEKLVVLEELYPTLGTTDFRIDEFEKESKYQKKSVLNHKSIGELEDVKAMTKKDLIDYWEKVFVPQNAYITIGGNFDLDELPKLFEKYFGQYKASHKQIIDVPAFSKADLASEPVTFRADKDLFTNHIYFTVPSMGLEAPEKLWRSEYFIFEVFCNLRRSRLYNLLRINKGLVYATSMYSAAYNKLGLVSFRTECNKQNLNEVIGIFIEEFKRLINEGINQDELEFVKNYAFNTWLNTYDHPTGILSWIEGQFLWGKEILMPEQVVKELEKVDLKLINNIIKKWDLDYVQLCVQGTEFSKEEIKKIKSLIKF